MDGHIPVTPIYEGPRETWQSRLRARLIDKYNEGRSNRIRRRKFDGEKLWEAMVSTPKEPVEHHNYEIEKEGQGPYSQYINISTNMHISNELTLCFPYLRHIEEKNKDFYHKEIRSISQKIKERRDVESWSILCRQYAPCLDLSQMVYYLFRMLNEGTSILPELSQKLKCRTMVLYYTLLAVKQYLYKNSNMFPVTYSLARTQKISLQNVSKAFKLLFCSICLIYDCPKHMVSEMTQNNNFQYLPRHNVDLKIKERRDNIIDIYSQLAIIYNKNMEDEDEGELPVCSECCYKKLDKGKWQKLVKERQHKSYSPIFMIHLKMGIQLYRYNPCPIASLLPPEGKTITCSQIFYYLINCSSVLSQLQFKFHANEKLCLLQEESKLSLQSKIKPKKKSKTKTKGSATNSYNQIFNGVCFHYFLDGVEQDINCSNCQCRQRGYCLPECQCSKQCQIPLKGCKCKGGGKCLSNCPCQKEKRVCHPLVCSGCYNWKESDSCKNNLGQYSRAKITRIGPSGIKEAGLGLFAGQFISKGSFVMKYLGEMIEDSSIEELRQNLSQNNIFYNFQINDNQSLDSRLFGNKARFINHSNKKANILSTKIFINEEETIIFKSIRDIKEGEELLFDYDPEHKLSQLKEKYPFLQ